VEIDTHVMSNGIVSAGMMLRVNVEVVEIQPIVCANVCVDFT
jgi:hypothetical protein